MARGVFATFLAVLDFAGGFLVAGAVLLFFSESAVTAEVPEPVAVDPGTDGGGGGGVTGAIGITGGAIDSEGCEFTGPGAGATPPAFAVSEALIFQVFGVGNCERLAQSKGRPPATMAIIINGHADVRGFSLPAPPGFSAGFTLSSGLVVVLASVGT